jgi:hypothetical protein
MKQNRKDYELTLRLNYRRLINILDQKTGREKRILRKYTQALDRAIQDVSKQKNSE